MNYIRFINEEGLITYLHTDGLVNIDISCNAGLCFINLSSFNKGNEAFLPIIFSLEFEDKSHNQILTESDYTRISNELKNKFILEFEKALKKELAVIDINSILDGLICSISLFARDMVVERLKELYRKQ